MGAPPLAAATVATNVDDGALRHAVETLAHARVQAAQAAQHAGGVASRRRDEGDALGGDVGAAVAREVATFAEAARRHGVPLADVLLALRATVRAAWGPIAIDPREAVIRETSRCCVKAFYETRAAAPSAATSAAASARDLA